MSAGRPEPAFLCLTLFGKPAAAQIAEQTWHLSVCGSRWVNADLLEIPDRTLTGENVHFVGAGLSRVVVLSFAAPRPGTDFAFRGNWIDLEGQVLRHFGDQSHWGERSHSCSERDRSRSSGA